MIGAVAQRWNDFWFRPVPQHGLVAMRVILSLQALWIILSRPDLPALTGWPEPFWRRVPVADRLTYGFPVRNLAAEWALWAMLILALLLTLFGVRVRISAAVAGVLLFHFAPLENLLSGVRLLGFRGLTQPVQGLLLLAFAPEPLKGTRTSADHRWPVAALQLLFTLTYFFAALSKFYDAGWRWASATNIRATTMTFATWPVEAPWAAWLISNPAVCWFIAVTTIPFELAFPAVLFSRRAARVLVPFALAGHVAIYFSMGIFFLSAPLLLLFVNWEWMARSVAMMRSRIAGLDRATEPSMQ